MADDDTGSLTLLCTAKVKLSMVETLHYINEYLLYNRWLEWATNMIVRDSELLTGS